MELTPAQVEDLRSRIPAGLKARFGLGRLLGAGGMGAVFEGQVPGVGKPCAVKVVLEARDPRLVERFEREARILAKVSHPNLVEIYDRGVEAGLPWIAMERIDGLDLKARAMAGEDLDADTLTRMVRGVTGALDALHARDVVHRDVKPGNICLDRHGRAILMDLGLALEEDRTRLTQIGSLAGTLGFLAPEVLLGGTPAASTDAYALGVTLWYLMERRLPFMPDALMTFMGRGRWEPLPAVVGPFAGSGLARLAAALADLDPAARPRDLAAVDAVLFGAGTQTQALPRRVSTSVSRPVEALPPPPPRPSLARLALPGLLLTTLVLGLVALRGRAPGPEPLDRSPPPPAAATEPAPGPAWPSDEAGQLAALARRLGYPPGPDPWLLLEMALYGRDKELFARATAALRELPDSGAARYFRLKAAEAAGRFDEVLALAGRLEYGARIDGYGEAKARIEALGHRLVLEGPAATRFDKAKVEAVLADCRKVEDRLRSQSGFAMRLARVELWDLMARRIHLRPAVNLPALEFADELYAGLVGELAGAGGYLTAQGLLLGSRLAFHLGDPTRCRVYRERFEAGALAPLEGLAEVREYWLWRLREDEAKMNEPANLAIFSRGAMTMHLEPARLPFPADRPGSVAREAQPTRPVVPDPPRPDPLVLEPEPGEDPAARLAAAGDRAVLEGRELVITPAWLDTHLPRSALAGSPLAEAVLVWPSAVLAYEDRFVDAGDERGYLQLLRRQDGLVRTRRGFTGERRLWYRGAWAELKVRRLVAELAGGGHEAALEAARRALVAASKLPGPWTVSEVRGFHRLWDWLRTGFEDLEGCPDLARETLRLGLLLLEGMAQAAPTGPGARRDLAREALAWLDLWSRSPARTEPTDGLVDLVRASLAPDPGPLAAELDRLGRRLATRPIPPAGSEPSAGCGIPGMPAPGTVLPPAGLAPAAAGDRARFEALFPGP